MSETRKTVGGLLGLHAQTPVQPGAGTALGVVDLPVQRERHTHWPNAAGSSLKGILRDACRERIAGQSDLDALERYDDTVDDAGVAQPAMRKGKGRDRADSTLLLNEMFGPPTAGASEFAGALSVTDGRLAAFPVRSLKGVFAWVTCPAVLDRLARDTDLAGLTPALPDFSAITTALEAAKHGKAFPCVTVPDCPCLVSGSTVLEEFEFKRLEGDPTPVARWMAETLLPVAAAYKGTRERFVRHLIVLHDDDFTHFARYATEVLARIRLDYNTKTVAGGALFYQEFLPAETLLYSVVLANTARGRSTATPTELLKRLFDFLPTVLQVGGDESVGKGYCGVRLATTNGSAK